MQHMCLIFEIPDKDRDLFWKVEMKPLQRFALILFLWKYSFGFFWLHGFAEIRSKTIKIDLKSHEYFPGNLFSG